MTFSGHLAVTALTFSVIRDPAILIPLNLVLHFAADAIPHVEWPSLDDSRLLSKAWVVADIAATLTLVFLINRMHDLSPFVWISAALAGLLPDLSNGLLKRYAPSLWHIHEYTHTHPHKPSHDQQWHLTLTGRTSSSVKIAMQILLILIAGVYLLER